MKLKSLAISLILLLGSVGSFATPVALDPVEDGTVSGTFSGFATGDRFTFVAANTGSSLDLASVTSTYVSKVVAGTPLSGFHISQIKLDGVDITDKSIGGSNAPVAVAFGLGTKKKYNNFDNWSFSIEGLTSGEHTIEVIGTAGTLSPNKEAFTGTITVTRSFSFGGLTSSNHTIEGLGRAGTLSANKGTFTETLTVTPAVPEPQSYALMLSGLGALGFISRRRRKLS